MERLERRRDQQRTALASFERKVGTLQSKGHAIQSAWDHVETLLTQTREAVGNHGWEEVRQRAKRIPWIEQVDPSEKRFSAILPDDDHEPKGPTVWLQLEATVHQNAQTYFEQARKHKDKLRGAERALERTETDLQKARKQEQDRIASGKVRSVRRSKRLWFERHRWTILDGGHLMIGGKGCQRERCHRSEASGITRSLSPRRSPRSTVVRIAPETRLRARPCSTTGSSR